MASLKLFWWKADVGSGNFGDELSRKICEALSRRTIVHSSAHDADIVAIGSVLEPWLWKKRSPSWFKGAIWGAGRMMGELEMQFPFANIAAVRGQLTHQSICDDGATVPMGDPGLLASMLVPLMFLNRNRFEVGVVPHMTERDHPKIKRLTSLSSEVRVIDPCAPVMDVVQQIRSCKRILASAMHGLIVADSLGIPNQWIRLMTGNEREAGIPDFKYMDYYSVFDKPAPKPASLQGDETVEQLIEMAGDELPPDVSEIQQSLISAFPFSST